MYKKLFLLLPAIILLITGNALANGWPGPLSAYTVAGNGIIDPPKSEFTLNETPWLYVELPKSGHAYLRTYWYSLDDPTNKFESHGWWDSTTDSWDELFKPGDETSWNNVKKVGEWQIDVTAFYTAPEHYHTLVNFTVTPEPLSTALFLIGGIPIAASAYKKRKKLGKGLAV